MEVKLAVVVLVAVALVINNPVVADFFFNHPRPKLGHLHDLKCVPGRTIIKITEKQVQDLNTGDSDSDDFRVRRHTRRTHMSVPSKDETCKVCVCSVEGKDEHCSNRPAENVNECLLVTAAMDEHNGGLPYEHTRSLPFRIRRDYLWHNDEIPYNAKAKCFRGHSYYSNSITANDTDIDVGSEIDSLLNYENEDLCFYCVCAVDGSAAGCIHRDVQYCNFFRVIRDDKAVRDRYTSLFEQDRPAYFRQLSWRMRRTMDNGIFDMVEQGIKLANSVNSLPVEKKCVPFVSEYSTCNDDNMCSGCTKCTCSSIATWTCQDVRLCEGNDNDADRTIDEEDEIFDNALTMLESAIDQNKLPAQKPKHPNVPDPQPINENSLLGGIKDYKMEDILTALMRPKRSATKTETKNSKHNKRSIEKSFKHPKTSNNTIKFYDTIDELNEDTLKNSNITGTLPAKKMDIIPKIEITRRSGGGENVSQSLHIEYNQPKAYNPITDNKIDGLDHDNKFDASHENLKTILGNHSQVLKDKDLSKIVVNELKKGSEVIGDSDAPVTSNITFTPENDTLTAMAFIAGNLLNKLWNMEKDSPGASAETDVVKHEKITNLLDLFKEPLNLRQETFLKNALEQLSTAIDKTKDVNNISICENIEEAKKRTFNGNDTNAGERPIISTAPCKQKKVKDEEDKEKKATVVAISKINNVLELIKKFETVQGHISELKHGPKLDFHDQTASQTKEHADKAELLSKEESNSLSIFGNILEKITRLLMPHRNNKKIAGQIKNKNLFGKNDNVMDKFKKLYNIDLSNMTVTAKDKLILDYLTHIDGNPDCLLNTKGQQGYKTLPNIEGNILLNLSEFFKMKSFSDLVKLLEPAEPHPVLRTPTVETTTKLVQTTTILELNKISKTLKDIDSVKFNSTKEKLKAHLKTIIEDLVELQNAKGINVKGNIKIADALPCIYNIINAGREQAVKKEDDIESGKKIIEIFNGLKKELKTAYSRRSFSNNPIPKERPKSAAVWERIVKNLNEKSKVKTRRLSEIPIPKSYDEIKEMMDGLENVSSTYKHKALLNDVLPASKLMMLKALDQDVQKSINVMEEIKLAYKTLSKLPADKFIEFEEFVGNVATSINLNEKITEKVKPTDRKYFVNEINSGNRLKNKLKKKSSLRYGEVQDNDDMRISRNQILNQLIKNRMQLYLKMKDDKEFDVNNDMNYNIAKRVLYYLDAGNYDLAREMFKVFVIQKQDKLGIALSNDGILDQLVDTTTPKFNDIPMRRMASHEKSPLIQFKEPTRLNHEMNFVNQDHLIKQLLNIKNMGM